MSSVNRRKKTYSIKYGKRLNIQKIPDEMKIIYKRVKLQKGFECNDIHNFIQVYMRKTTTFE